MFPNLEAEREKKGMLRGDLARYLGITRDTYASWLEGRFPVPRCYVNKLCKFFNCSAEYLFSGAYVKRRYRHFLPVMFF